MPTTTPGASSQESSNRLEHSCVEDSARSCGEEDPSRPSASRLQHLELLQKLGLLQQQCMLLRSDVLYLSQTMNVTKDWVLKNIAAAVQAHLAES